MSTPTFNVTISQFMTSVLNNLRNNSGQTNTLGQGPSQNILDFMIAWAHKEGGSVTNNAKFNPLNTMQAETGSTDAGNGIQAYQDSATGVKATVDALSNGNYQSLKNALETNDELNLGFTKRPAPSYQNAMASNVAGDLSVWVSGRRTPIDQQYATEIMQLAGISNATIENGSMEAGTGESPANIATWGNTSLGSSVTGTTPQGGVWTWQDIVKIALGGLLLLIGAVMILKDQMPNSAIIKTASKVVPFL